MATTGAAKAKTKVKANQAAPPTMIDIVNGVANKLVAYVNLEGTVQFSNRDAKDYRLRLWTNERDKHAVVDVLLPQVSSITLMTDPLSKLDEQCDYDILPTTLQPSSPSRSDKAATGGGGRIIIGPTPAPPKGKR
jgi:hypothetical protein